MGFFKKLLGIGATAGATVAAVRVADRVKQNNPNGVGDVNNDGKVDARDVLAEVGKAAGEVYNATAANVKEKAPGMVQNAKDALGSVLNGPDDKA